MREREAKMVVDEGFELPDLTDAVTNASLGKGFERAIEDVYYDTADLRLARWGCTLRHRAGTGWAVKIPHRSRGVVLDRSEVRVGGGPDAPPVRALNLVAPLTRRAPVGEVAQVRTWRHVRTWALDGGEPVAELTDDDVWGVTSAGNDVRFREIEVELAENADARVLPRIVAPLQAAVGDPQRPIPKVVRILGESAAHEPDVVAMPLPSDPTGREVIQRAIASSVTQLLLQLPIARLGVDPEGVHQARVATRRMNSDLKTFAPLLDPEWVIQQRTELRWLLNALGAVRDCDVLAGKLRTVADRHREVDRAAADEVLDYIERRRRANRRRLLRCLDDERATQLFDHLVVAAASPLTVRRAERPAADTLPKLVRKHWKRLDRTIQALGRHPAAEELHAVRIMAKRLRYATEAVAPAAGKPAKKFAKQAAKIQDALGELNDAAVARAWLWSATDDLTGTAAFSAGQMAQILADEAGTHDRVWKAAHRSMTEHTAWFS